MFIYVYHALEVYMEPAQIRNISLSLPDFFQVSKAAKECGQVGQIKENIEKGEACDQEDHYQVILGMHQP